RIVAEHAEGDGRVFIRGDGVVPGDGRIVRGIDGDRDTGRRRPAMTVLDRIREAIRPVEVRGRRVRHRAVGVEDDRAVRALRHARYREGIAHDVAVVR